MSLRSLLHRCSHCDMIPLFLLAIKDNLDNRRGDETGNKMPIFIIFTIAIDHQVLKFFMVNDSPSHSLRWCEYEQITFRLQFAL